MQLVSKFFASAIRRRSYKYCFFGSLDKGQARGVIRATAQRERLLHPSPAKSMQRLTRMRLVKSYARRFGEDDFYLSLSAKRFDRYATRFWLPRGFAHWKERVLGKKPRRPFV